MFQQTKLTLPGYIFILLISLAPVAKWDFKNHPNQYIYYNEIVGGVKGASIKGYDLDYWGNSFREAAIWLNDFFKDFETPGRKLLVASNNASQVTYYLNNKIFEQTQGGNYDISIDLYRQYSLPPGHIIKTIGVDGAALAFITASQPLFELLKKRNIQEIPRLNRSIPPRPGSELVSQTRCRSGLFTLESFPDSISSDRFYRCENLENQKDSRQ